MDFDVGVAFVILELDVIKRLVFLDQVHFQDQRFQLRTDDDPFNILDFVYQLTCPGIFPRAGMEIGTHSVADVYCLAHINYLSLVILHQVTAGLVGDGFQDILDVFRDLHNKKIVSQAGLALARIPFWLMMEFSPKIPASVRL